MKMKILHVCLANFYIDNYSYQENLLPKYHKKMGYEVEIIASLDTFNEKGESSYSNKDGIYINEDGIKVTRVPYKFNNRIGRKLKIFPSIKTKLEKFAPDIIFIHGCQFFYPGEFVNYYREKNVRIIVDNHADFSNSATNWLSKNILHKFLWKRKAQMLNAVTETFFGVLPARVDFLKNVYSLPKEKCKLLVMGGDDEFIDKYNYIESRRNMGKKFPIETDDFLIITAGKIDEAKMETFNLINAVKKINDPKVKLIIFGSVTSNLEDKFYSEIDDKNVIYGGWMENSESYMYFKGSDLAIFPGRHSVYWEQVVSLGKPLVVKEWEGTKHVNVNGNAIFLTENTTQELVEIIKNLQVNKKLFNEMEKNASLVADKFRYSRIAKESLS